MEKDFDRWNKHKKSIHADAERPKARAQRFSLQPPEPKRKPVRRGRPGRRVVER